MIRKIFELVMLAEDLTTHSLSLQLGGWWALKFLHAISRYQFLHSTAHTELFANAEVLNKHTCDPIFQSAILKKKVRIFLKETKIKFKKIRTETEKKRKKKLSGHGPFVKKPITQREAVKSASCVKEWHDLSGGGKKFCEKCKRKERKTEVNQRAGRCPKPRFSSE